MKIHGNVKLKLKDARTGRVLRTEEGENTFQTAVLADYLAADGDNSNDLYANTSFKAEPWKYLCGGLLLFRDQIEVGSKVMPAGNVMTGKASAGIVNNGSPTELGSWNDTLSNASFDGEKMQITQYYDFTPSQANGKISCVSLTSREGGLVGYGNADGSYPGTKYELGKMLGIDYGNYGTGALGVLAKNGYRYLITVSNGVFTVRETRTSAIVASVFSGLYQNYTFDYSAENIPSVFKEQHPVFHYCGNNIIRFVCYNYYVAPNDSIYYGEFNCSTKELEFKTITNTSSRTVCLATNYYDNKQASFTADGKLVACYSGDGGYIPIIFSLSNGAVLYDGQNDFNSSKGTWNSNAFVQVTEKLYIFGGSIPKIYDAENGTVKKIDCSNLSGSTSCSFDEDIAAYQTGGRSYSGYYSSLSYVESRIVKFPFYLATIYNLSTSVIKDATMSMEVMYKLEEA